MQSSFPEDPVGPDSMHCGLPDAKLLRRRRTACPPKKFHGREAAGTEQDPWPPASDVGLLGPAAPDVGTTAYGDWVRSLASFINKQQYT